MSLPHDWYGQMPQPSLDDPTADRILLGTVPPDEAPPGYAGLAALARHVTVPALPFELAGETVVVESMLAVASPTANRPRMPAVGNVILAKRMFTAKVAAVALVGTLGLGSAAAAAAGALPGQSHTSPPPLQTPSSTVTSTAEPHPGSGVGTSTHGANLPGSADTIVSRSEGGSLPTSGATDVEGTDETGDSATGATEDPIQNSGATGPEADNTSEDPPAPSTPPTTRTQDAPSAAATSGPSDTGATGLESSAGTAQPSPEADGEQTPGTTTAPLTASAANDG